MALTQELWRPICGWENFYEVSSHGLVRSLDRVITHPKSGRVQLKGRVLKPWKNGKGYLSVLLHKDGLRLHKVVHQLVAEAFIGPRPSGKSNQVLHGPNGKLDNTPSNLRYGSQVENEADKLISGTSNRGCRNRTARLSDNDAREIRGRVTAGESCICIAKEYGVSKATIYDIKSSRSWGWLFSCNNEEGPQQYKLPDPHDHPATDRAMDQVYQALSEPSDEELLQAVADLRAWVCTTVDTIKSASPWELDADDILEICRAAITASRRYDPRPLPAPWQWLKDAKPEPGQHCEWVALGPCWAGTGQGEWTEIDTSVNPDDHFWSAPGCGRVIINGFRDGKGIAVYDPTITAWRLTATPALDLNFAAIEPTTLAESGLTFTRATPNPDATSIAEAKFSDRYSQGEGIAVAPGVKVKSVRYWPERLSTDALEALTQ